MDILADVRLFHDFVYNTFYHTNRKPDKMTIKYAPISIVACRKMKQEGDRLWTRSSASTSAFFSAQYREHRNTMADIEATNTPRPGGGAKPRYLIFPHIHDILVAIGCCLSQGTPTIIDLASVAKRLSPSAARKHTN